MALLVFLTFLTLFTNSYIPIWMVDNERGHMNTVMDQFGNLKGKVDMMSVSSEITGNSNLNMYQSIALGAPGIPVFASPTAGLLTYSPYGAKNSTMRVDFNYYNLGKESKMNDTGGGKIQLYMPNRYYVQQWVGYENGAILIGQQDGQAMKAYPSLEIDKTEGGSIQLAWTQVDLTGANASLAGTGNAGVNMDLIYYNSQTYNTTKGADGYGWVNFTFTTQFGTAWWSYLTNVTKSLLSSDYTLTWTPLPIKLQNQPNSNPVIIKLTVKHVSSIEYGKATMQMSIQVS
jgi:hypothetical protein